MLQLLRVGVVVVLGVPTVLGPTLASEVPEPSMMKRSVWERKPALTKYMVKQKGPYDAFVIHHTGTFYHQREKGKTAQEMRNIQMLHQGNKQRYRPGLKGKNWGDFAYHYFIDIDGTIAEGRSLKYEGDSGTNYNMSGRLLIVLQGHFDSDQPNDDQMRSLNSLVPWLAQKHSIDPTNITGHNDNTDKTECPGKNLKAKIPDLKLNAAKALAG